MDCPMRIGSSGYMYECKKAECAWWNEKRKECSVKTFMCNSEHKRVTIEKNDWGRDI